MELTESAPTAPARSLLLVGLVVTDDAVQSCLLDRSTGRLLHSSGVYRYGSAEHLLVRADESLQDLGQESEGINETVFGVDPWWVSEGQLTSDSSLLLEKVAKELSLTPRGFVTSVEVVVQHLTKTLAKPNSLMLLVGSSALWLGLCQNGQLVSGVKVGRSDAPLADSTEALARLGASLPATARPLPGLVLIASLSETDESLRDWRSSLTELDWVSTNLFYQVPSLEIATASVLLTEFGIYASQAFKSVNPAVASPPLVETAIDPRDENVSSVGQSFGVSLSAKDLDQIPDRPPVKAASKRRLAAAWPKFKLPGGSRMGAIVLGLVAGLLTVLVLGWWVLVQRSAVEITVTRKPIAISRDVLFELGASTAVKGALPLQGQMVSKTLETTVRQQTTGIKLVGDKAKGEVVLLNKTNAAKTFDAGTVLKAGAVELLLDAAVSVPAASVSATANGELKEYGRATAAVTAKVFGEEANLPKDQALTVASFDQSSYSASTKAALSGGASRELQVVAEVDRNAILTEARAELIKRARTEWAAAATEGQYFAEPAVSKVSSAKYSAATGDEAQEVSLILTAELSSVTYTAAALAEAAKTVLSEAVPSGYQLVETPPQVLSAPASTSAKSALIKANLSTQAVPSLDSTTLLGKVKGRSIAEAISTLQATEGVAQAQVVVKPSLAKPLIQHRLPTSDQRIKLEVK